VYYFDYPNHRLARAAMDGGPSEPVPGTEIPGVAFMRSFALSPDGRQLAYLVRATSSQSTTTKLALKDLASPGSPARLLDVDPLINDNFLQYTPDGKSVVYVISPGAANLWVQPLDGSKGRQITNLAAKPIIAFHWSTDGKTLGVLRATLQSDVVLLRESNQ